MTRSVTVVNTSNWDGEDYIVKRVGFDNKLEETRLRPGEYFRFAPRDGQSVTLVEASDGGPVPFSAAQVKGGDVGKRADEQVWPRVKVEFCRD